MQLFVNQGLLQNWVEGRASGGISLEVFVFLHLKSHVGAGGTVSMKLLFLTCLPGRRNFLVLTANVTQPQVFAGALSP